MAGWLGVAGESRWSARLSARSGGWRSMAVRLAVGESVAVLDEVLDSAIGDLEM